VYVRVRSWGCGSLTISRTASSITLYIRIACTNVIYSTATCADKSMVRSWITTS
jgi:hypothetical protein